MCVCYLSLYVCYSDATVSARQKVYGCALPPGYGSEDSQVLPCFFNVVVKTLQSEVTGSCQHRHVASLLKT